MKGLIRRMRGITACSVPRGARRVHVIGMTARSYQAWKSAESPMTSVSVVRNRCGVPPWGMPAEVRDLVTAQHEAAHAVVGWRLGLRLRYARLGPARSEPDLLGVVLFSHLRGDDVATALMMAAGIAWDRMLRFHPAYSRIDAAELRKLTRGRKSYEACITAAMAMLAGLTQEHARVTRALLERDIVGAAALDAVCRGLPSDEP